MSLVQDISLDMDEVDESRRYNGVNGEWEESWSELSPIEQNLWRSLGETKSTWDNDTRGAFSGVWSEMSSAQQRAATLLCFTEDSWNAEHTPAYPILPPTSNVGGNNTDVCDDVVCRNLKILIDPLLVAQSNGLRHLFPLMYFYGNESEGMPVEVFAYKLNLADGAQKTIMGEDWIRQREEYFTLHEFFDDSDLESWFYTDFVHLYDMKNSLDPEVAQVLALFNEVKSVRSSVLKLLNGEGGQVFSFARLSDPEESMRMYTVGLGCITAHGSLVGWQQEPIVWT